MAADTAAMGHVAGQIRDALESADLDRFRDLLDPDVTWGPPDEVNSGCRNRDQVLAWYRRGRARGVRAVVTETGIHGDRILVGLSVFDGGTPSESGDPTERWQIMTVRDGLVADIRGFDDRTAAVSRLG
ncbi:MAG: nuclear transport factor 2 family protein [Acidimicrobiales bacterium]|jgi:ketosteroid isomerase-like protein